MYILSCLFKRVLSTYPLNYFMEDFKRYNSAWCITDGSAGMISQVTGLAMAMNLKFGRKIVKLNFPWNLMPLGILPILNITFKNLYDFKESELPRFIITCGRRSAYLSLYLKRKYDSKIINIHIQNPKININNFDLIIAPNHDNLFGKNVISSTLAMNHISKELIASEMKNFEKDFKNSEDSICSIFIGGQSNNYIFDENTVKELIITLKEIKKNNLIKFVFIFSRRTNQFIIDKIKDSFIDTDNVWLDKGRNPYIALLGYSKYIICTSDSVSMVSEAITSMKSVYIFRLKNKKTRNRIDNFIDDVIEKGYARQIHKKIIEFDHNYINEMSIIANEIHKKFN